MRLVLLIAALALTVAGQSQREMNTGAEQEYLKVDKELNAVYTAVLRSHAKDSRFVAKLRAAQRAWVTFRDAHVAAMYPEPDKGRAYGSMYPLCQAQLRTELTQDRIKQLREWTEGGDETDACSGSRNARAGWSPSICSE